MQSFVVAAIVAVFVALQSFDKVLLEQQQLAALEFETKVDLLT